MQFCFNFLSVRPSISVPSKCFFFIHFVHLIASVSVESAMVREKSSQSRLYLFFINIVLHFNWVCRCYFFFIDIYLSVFFNVQLPVACVVVTELKNNVVWIEWINKRNTSANANIWQTSLIQRHSSKINHTKIEKTKNKKNEKKRSMMFE